MPKSIVIKNFTIDATSPPFVIAEMSGNHNQSIERAFEIIDAAVEAGAHAIKIQTYTADTLTIDVSHGEFQISDPSSLWAGKNLFELYKQAYTPWEWHKAIFDYANKKGIICFSTPFDETAVEFLESLNVPAYKIASFENNHIPLLIKIAQTKKPIIISTGLSNLSDIELAVNTIRENGGSDIVLLKCTSTYPANPGSSNLLTIPHLSKMFNCHVGLSDHTLGIGVAVASVSLGAKVIEKHFTLSRKEGGVDAAFSLEPGEFKSLVNETERAYSALGTIQYGILDEERKSLAFKRSIYIVKDMEKGELFSRENIRIIRPGLGMAPKYFNSLIGKSINRAAKKGTALTFDLLT